MSGRPKRKTLPEGESSMPGKPKPRPKNFGSISDYQGIKPEGPSNTIVDYSVFNSNKEGKGTSTKTGLLVVGLFSCLIFAGGWFTWKAIPDQMKNYTLDMIPFIERVEPDKGLQILKQTPGPVMTMPEFVVKTAKQNDPIYHLDGILNDGNIVRVDIKVKYIVKNDGGPIADHHAKNMVRMAVRKVISEYSSEDLYTANRLEVEAQVLNKLQGKYFRDIIEAQIISFDYYFNARTKALFDGRKRAKAELERAQQRKKTEILEAEAQIARAKIHRRVLEEEMKVREFELKRKLEIERSKQLYQAETKRLVNEILDKRKEKLMDAK